MAPLYSVPTQLKTLMAVKTPTSIESTPKTPASKVDWPDDEHVVAPGEEADEGDAQRRVGDRLVAEDVLAAKAADHLADHAHRREHHDVDGRVRVEPEQVLEEHRVAAARRVEEAEAEGVLDARPAAATSPSTGVASTWMMLVA